MASIKDLKKRIGTVKNTQQTTKAMKMVSAAKLRRAQDAIQSNRPYAKQIGSLVEHLLNLPEVTTKSPYLGIDGDSEETNNKKLLLIVVTSDRGLCGGFNANIIRFTSRWMKENAKKYERIDMSFLGKRGHDFFKTKKVNIAHNIGEVGGKASFQRARKATDGICKAFLNGEYNEVKIIFNEFKNAASQRVVIENFLPLVPKASDAGALASSMMIIKPNPNEVLESLLDKHFAIHFFRVMLDSQAGEHGARMSAMENATKNAGEMIKKLTLQYNKQRQAGITKELLEIISGSESQKQG